MGKSKVPRLSDTSALTSNSSGAVEHSVHSRKIDNGFIIRTSTCNPDTGEYKSSEVFSKGVPKIIPAQVVQGASPDDGNSLREAVASLKGK